MVQRNLKTRTMKKQITNQYERELAALTDFKGKYVQSLIKSAKRTGIEGETIKELLRAKRAQIKEQMAKEAKSFAENPKSLRELREKAMEILSSFHTGHSMGCYRNMETKVRGKWMQLAANHDLDTYSNSCTWSPTYGQFTISLTKTQLRNIKKIEGVWTLQNEDGSTSILEETGRKNSYKVELKKL